MIDFELGEEYEGEWWLADRPDLRTPGILKLNHDGSARLQVLGELSAAGQLELTWGAELPIVPALFGSVRGRRVSALSAALVGFRRPRDPFGGDGAHGITSRTFDPRYLLVGEHVRDEQHRFKSVILKIRHLDDWADLVLDIWNDVPGKPFYRRRAQVKGAVYTFFGGRTEAVGVRSRTASSYHSVRIDVTNPVNLREMFYLWIRPLLSFLSVSVAAEAAILAQTLPVAPHDWTRPGPAYQLFTRGGVAEPASEELRSWEILMPLRDGVVQKRLKRWLEIDREAAHGLSNLSALFSASNRNGANRLLNAATALESLHRALGPGVPKDPSLRRRRAWIARQLRKEDRDWFYSHTSRSVEPSLAARMEAFAQPIHAVAVWLVGDISDWAERLRVARNGLAHALQRHMDPAIESLYVHALTEASAAIGTARLMVELGYDEADVLKRHQESPRLRGISDIWREALAESERAAGRRSRP